MLLDRTFFILTERGDIMKKILLGLFIIGLAVYLTWDNDEKQKRKEYHIEQIEENIAPYTE